MKEPYALQGSLEQGGILLITIRGSLDIFSYTILRDDLQKLRESLPAMGAVFDLSEVTYVASSGWAVLMSFAKALVRSGSRAAAFGPQPDVQRAYDSMHVETILPCFSNRTLAEKSVNPEGS